MGKALGATGMAMGKGDEKQDATGAIAAMGAMGPMGMMMKGKAMGKGKDGNGCAGRPQRPVMTMMKVGP